jgi:hypothetical protein
MFAKNLYTMRIYFGTALDFPTHLEAEQALGLKGLLLWLEQQLGFSFQIHSDQDRLARYEGVGGEYTPLQYLQMRDALKAGGWDFLGDGAPSDKLKLLAALEAEQRPLSGLADCLEDVREALEAKPNALPEIEFVLREPRRQMPAPYQRLLQLLEAHQGAVVRWEKPQPCADPNTDLGKLQQSLLFTNEPFEYAGDGTFEIYTLQNEEVLEEYVASEVEEASWAYLCSHAAIAGAMQAEGERKVFMHPASVIMPVQQLAWLGAQEMPAAKALFTAEEETYLRERGWVANTPEETAQLLEVQALMPILYCSGQLRILVLEALGETMLIQHPIVEKIMEIIG